MRGLPHVSPDSPVVAGQTSLARGPRSRPALWSFLGLAFALSLVASLSSQEPAERWPPVPLERTLGVGQSTSFAVSLAAGDLVEVELNQLDGNLALTLHGEDESKLTRANLWYRAQPGTELIWWVAERSGRYRLEVEAIDGLQGRGRFVSHPVRAATSADLERHRVERRFDSAIGADGAEAQAAALSEVQVAFAEIGQPGRAALVAALRSQTLVRAGQVQESIEAAASGIPLAEEAGDLLALGRCRYQVAAGLAGVGRSDELEPAIAMAIETLETTNDGYYLPAALRVLAGSQSKRGERDAARATYRRARELSEAAGDPSGTAAVLNDQARIDIHAGRFFSALQLMNRALELVSQVGNQSYEVLMTLNLGGVHAEIGDRPAALELWAQAEKLTEGLSDEHTRKRVVALVTNNRAFDLHRTGDHQAAYELMRAAAVAAEALGDAALHADATIKLGMIAASLDDFAQADAHFATAERMVDGLADRNLEATLWLERGLRYVASGSRDRAVADLRRALAAAEEVGNRNESREVLLGLARAHRAGGDLGEALAWAERAVNMSDAMRSDVTAIGLRTFAFAEVRKAHDLWLELFLEQVEESGDRTELPRAFEIAELGRSRSLIELLTRSRDRGLEELPAALREQFDRAEVELSSLQRQLVEAREQGAADAELSASIRQAKSELELLDGKARRLDPIYAVSRPLDSVSVAAVQASLAPTTAVLQFQLGTERASAFFLSRDRFEVVDLAPTAQLEGAVAALREQIARPGRFSAAGFSRSVRVYELLVEPVDPWLAGVDELVVVPDGVLFGLPFEVLIAALPKTGAVPDYLLRRLRIRYSFSSSIDTLSRPGRKQVRPGSLVAFAAPSAYLAGNATERGLERLPTGFGELPFAAEEARAIGALFGSESRLYVGKEARESTLKRSLGVREARFLHFATHAVASDVSPAESSLILAWPPESGEDGLLQTREVLGLDLQAELVVLSGCETGLGVRVHGEGLVGLSQAFVAAGASNMVVSLWQVADRSATELMTGFYRSLLAKSSPGELEVTKTAVAESLRQAKLALLADPRYAHPYYWAPFVTIGGPGG